MYKVTIGLEVHVELNTKSKMFSPSINSYDKKLNTNISVIDFAFPGTLPTVNKEAVNKAISLAVALNTEISPYLMFDRKNYYYPDLPKGFQITQMTKPLGKNGYLEIMSEEGSKKVYIHQIHIEEDAASLDHKDTYSVINYNRVGVPLVEIVTEPCIESVDEAINFLETLRNVIRYLNISDADQTKGQIRCDVNVSLRKEESDELGVRAEVKNVNSFQSVREALVYEIERQTECLNNNIEIKRETRRYSPDDKKTYSLREKADALDYKYYVEPNIPKLDIEPSLIKTIESNMVTLPTDRMKKYINDYDLSYKEAKTLVREKEISDLFDNTVNLGSNPREASNWITMKLTEFLNRNSLEFSEISITPEMLNELISLINNKIISNEQAKKVFEVMINESKMPKLIVKELGMEQITDEEEITKFINDVLDNNIDAVNTYKSGKTNIVGFLMGQVLKLSGGKINPGLANKILNIEIQKR
jgi:aspartyl-tRNA(Asn)/glutamyl-tRNA(Gln) amidotransferase subunit B